MDNNKFTWVPLYMELASALLRFKEDRSELVKWIYDDLGQIKSVNGNSLTNYLHMKDGSQIEDIDPFSVYGIFNRGLTWENRTEILRRFKSFLGLKESVPTDFDGIPIVDSRRAFFFSWGNDNEKVIRDFWTLFENVINEEDIEAAFKQVIQNEMPRYSLTMCLFWVRPDKYLSLDSRNRRFLATFGLPSEYPMLNYDEYAKLLSTVESKMKSNEIPYTSFMDFSYSAWKIDTTSPKVWMWKVDDETFTQNIIKAGCSAKGGVNFASIKTKKELEKAYQKAAGNTDVKIPFAYWQLMRDVKVGDIVVAFKSIGKSGHQLHGWGRFTSECEIISNDKNPIQRKVEWHSPQPKEPVNELNTNNSMFFHLVEGIEADNIIKLLNVNGQPSTQEVIPTGEKQYWWLVAKPKIWSLSEMNNGEVQDYTLYNDNGNQRRIFQNFLNAKAGDVVIGYEATPTKQIIALLEIAKENDGNRIFFRKTETLSTPIDYSVLKNVPELQEMEFMVNPNGSLFKLTEEEFNTVMEYIREENPIQPTSSVTKYTKEDFLNEVFVTEEDYETLRSLLLRKKNLILQGAPGVGKTYAANRLAYAIMGEVNNHRIEQIQFHQNYCYEDFMMGYKPNDEGGFDMRTGVFYNFCRRAAADRDNCYFFIIDEINRGNLSKIFGELLMLIESDYRDHPIKLSYRDEKFSVPSNLYIIGMMNTADRSLAMIDYALRRRFSFFEMKPGFESYGFKGYIENLGNSRLENVVNAIIELNKTIIHDDSLGSGFCIGHSYFCNLKNVDDVLLKEIVEYDIIPMIREYWFDNDNKFNEESHKLREALK